MQGAYLYISLQSLFTPLALQRVQYSSIFQNVFGGCLRVHRDLGHEGQSCTVQHTSIVRMLICN